RISKKIYDKIMRIAENLEYVPNPIARTLTTKKNGSIGLLFPQSIEKAFSNPYLAELLRGIGSICIEYDSAITLVAPEQNDIGKAVRHAAVDAFIAVGLEEYMITFQILKARQIPFICIDAVTEEDIYTVISEDELGAYILMNEVISYGHREIAVISLKPSKIFVATRNSAVNDLRIKGVSAASVKKEVNLHFFNSDCSIEGGMDAASLIFSNSSPGRKITSIVCLSDIIALGVYKYCAEHKLNIPGDISVCGFDDIPGASLVSPGLTTMRQFIYKKGRSAGKMVFEILNTGTSIRRICLKPELVKRGSLGRIEINDL
ncbi:MAG: LacI family DNA-binding transcriptional regulator, partial [Spirochaetales bacterium]|nr:LacI family DNA-binding transcriptional regulator [Spirochaetales bacterium]